MTSRPEPAGGGDRTMAAQQQELVVTTTSDLAAARALVATVAHGQLDPERVGDVTLATSELVTNALEYGDGPVRLEVTIADDVLRLGVDSTTVGEVVVPADAPVDAVRGRGLLIVTALSDSFAVDTHDDRVTVTCEFRLRANVNDPG